MAKLLTGITTYFKNLHRQVFQWPVVMAGRTDDNQIVLLSVDSNGYLRVAGGSSGGDASAANQLTQIAALGAPADTPAGTATASASLLAHLKYSNQLNQVALQLVTGQVGSKIVEPGSPVTPTSPHTLFTGFVPMSPTVVIDEIESDDIEGALDGKTIYLGSPVYGRFTSIELTSGWGIALYAIPSPLP